MTKKKIIYEDLVSVKKKSEKSELITILAWGDEINVIDDSGEFVEIEAEYYEEQGDGSYKKVKGIGLIKKSVKLKTPETSEVLKVSFVDVQQGDASHLETPKGKVLLIDGGDNQLFARYLAQHYNGTTQNSPREIDAIIITHGDADHFAGLAEIYKSEENKSNYKKLFLFPKRIFHNGIVKGPSTINKKKIPIEKIFGETKKYGNKLYITELEDDLRNVKSTRFNKPFQIWVEAIKKWSERDLGKQITVKRLEYGDDDQFSFLQDENIEVKVLGPFVERKEGLAVLPILHEPSKSFSARTDDVDDGRYSESHTINGHSIVLQLKYGNVRFLFSGDLNEESEDKFVNLVKRNGLDLKSEIFKVPHHGSADFTPEFLDVVSPVVSVISSGDESAKKEYIHPRATLIGALGKHSRLEESIIFVTELVAFFEVMGWAKPDNITKEMRKKLNTKGQFFSFRRAAFGIVNVRTDGKRVLVYTNSGRKEMKEAYAFNVDLNGKIEFVNIKKK